jgi:Cys-tRNA(Pro)/Cys-tRNA(Cys) deacylase
MDSGRKEGFSMGKQDKTNCMRVLESKKIAYAPHLYEADPTLSGGDIAAILGEDPSQVFKTLVTVGKPQKYYVFVVPVNEELNLKKAAAAAGEKSVCMIPQRDLLPLTGYVHGGCSPVGMKKVFPTFIDETAQLFDVIFVSGGKVGLNLEIAPDLLCGFVPAQYADLTRS